MSLKQTIKTKICIVSLKPNYPLLDFVVWAEDLDKNKIGDVPYRPISIYSMIVEKNPPAMMLFRSLIVALMDKT
ncbi:MAG: hypothetical protein K5Q00_01245, partial [Gammaproteobacteria bacterium]|nr:hypothetical protein [Gammaproteobacteria bacterium]